MQAQPLGLDVYARHTARDGSSYVQYHRVWDKDTFFASRQAEAKKLNEEAKPGEGRKAKVDQITEEQYRKERA
jgi:hypothetical protein